MKKSSAFTRLTFPDAVPDSELAPGRALTVPAPLPDEEVSLRRHYRRSPFYLKIAGLEGPRPKYDVFGRLEREE
jgi:hypothetical protein